MAELMCLKEMMLTKTTSHVNMLFVIIITFFRIHFRFQPKVYDVCHDIIQNAMSFNDVLIHFRYMSKY